MLVGALYLVQKRNEALRLARTVQSESKTVAEVLNAVPRDVAGDAGAVKALNAGPAQSSVDHAPEKLAPQLGGAVLGTQEERLREYAALTKKVLLRDADRVRKLEILEDPKFLQAMGEYLKTGGDGKTETYALQALLEARRFSMHSLSEQVLQSVVADPRIEDAGLVMSERERLAETKAEVMYLWSSVSAQAISVIPRSLPGEVSQKLWSNVLYMQKQNAEASNEVQKRYAATGSHLAPPSGFNVGQ